MPPSEREIPSTIVIIAQPIATFWRSTSSALSSVPRTTTSHTMRPSLAPSTRMWSNCGARDLDHHLRHRRDEERRHAEREQRDLERVAAAGQQREREHEAGEAEEAQLGHRRHERAEERDHRRVRERQRDARR